MFNRARKRWLERRRRKRAEKRGETVAEKAEEVQVVEENGSKPWWRSVGVIGGLVVVAGWGLSFAGVDACPDGTTLEQAQELACVPVQNVIDRLLDIADKSMILVGGLVTIWGRIRATKKVTLT